MSQLEETLLFQIRAYKLPEPEREYRFAAHHVGGPGKGVRHRLKEAGLKDWRFDMAWVEQRFAVEVEGGAWIGGRHTRGKGFEDDLEKYHFGTLQGWTIYRCSRPLIQSGQAVMLIRRMLEAL
jgi:hypothetical protein